MYVYKVQDNDIKTCGHNDAMLYNLREYEQESFSYIFNNILLNEHRFGLVRLLKKIIALTQFFLLNFAELC